MSILEVITESGRSWRRVGDLFEITRKPRGLERTAYADVPFVPMEAISQDGVYAPRYELRSSETISSGTYFERGDVLIAKITPSFENGKQAITDQLPAPFGYATTEVIPVRPIDAGTERRLLFFYLKHPDIRNHVAERMEGSTGRQRVPEDVLLDLPFPVFDFCEQRAVAGALETVQRSMAVESGCIDIAQSLKQAAMKVLFTRGLRGEPQKDTEIGMVPDGWDVMELGSLGRIGNGSTPKKSVTAYWKDGTYPWLTSAKVYDRDISAADQMVTDLALKECHLPRIKPGAILIAITGQGRTLGHCAILRMEATVNQHIAYLATDLDRADPSFLRGYIETQYDYLRQVGAAGGSTKGALTCAFLRRMLVPLPSSLDEQREIVAILDAIDRKIDLHRRKRAVLEEMFQSLLHKLMTGEIRVADLDLSALDRDIAPAVVA